VSIEVRDIFNNVEEQQENSVAEWNELGDQSETLLPKPSEIECLVNY
jgi:hypothetical protein